MDRVFAWGNNERRAQLKGRPCRILVRSSRMHSVLVEFPGGERVVTSERALRRRVEPRQPERGQAPQ